MEYASRDEHQQAWKRWRKQVKRAEKLMNAMRVGLGLPIMRVSMPGGWRPDWENADKQRDEYVVELQGKASQGISQTPARVFGARALWRQELDGAIEEALDGSEDDFEARAKLVEIKIGMEIRKAEMSDVDAMSCADLMDAPGDRPRQVDAPRNWYHSKDGIAWAHTNYQLMDDGTIVCWLHGKPATAIPPKSDKQVRFTTQHGWDVPAFVKRGHGDDWRCRHTSEAVEAALEMVEADAVPAVVRRRGRPRLEWVVLATLGELHVRGCEAWAGRHKREEMIDHALTHEYAERVSALVG